MWVLQMVLSLNELVYSWCANDDSQSQMLFKYKNKVKKEKIETANKQTNKQ